MKKILGKISLLIFCVLISTVIFAQNGIEFGVKGGLNLAHQNLAHKKQASLKIHPGIHAGIFAEYTLNNFVGIQGELLYSMMGSEEEYSWPIPDTDNLGNAKIIYKNDYVVLPIIAKLYVIKGLSLDLGPQLGYIISAKDKINKNGETTTTNYYDIVDGKFDVAFAMGLSYKLSNRFSVSGRFNLGITEFNNGYDLKNNVAQFGIGYRLK
ncbi:MAG: PorT family protein [Bacteroidales bacterium]|jgi:hypothetical protein|nr:PorT family protein [Bacteroidales bacterium]